MGYVRTATARVQGYLRVLHNVLLTLHVVRDLYIIVCTTVVRVWSSRATDVNNRHDDLCREGPSLALWETNILLLDALCIYVSYHIVGGTSC